MSNQSQQGCGCIGCLGILIILIGICIATGPIEMIIIGTLLLLLQIIALA